MVPQAPEEENMAVNTFIHNQNDLLLSAIDACNVEQVDAVLRSCGKLTQEVVNAHCKLMNATALHLAAAKGKMAGVLVKKLIAFGADVNICDNIGGIPLHTAALIGNSDAVQALIKAGSNVNKKFEINTTSEENLLLTYSTQYKSYPSTCKLPFSECRGRTPLHQAVLSGSAECAQLLLQAKANVNAQDDNSMTPLLLAGIGIVPGNKREIQRYEEMVEQLVLFGANANMCSNVKHTTAMHQAAELCSLRAMKCLLDANVSLKDMDSSGVTTILHIAASKGCFSMVDLILKSGGLKFVNAKDHKGYTPLHKAAAAAARDCLALLVKHGGDLAAETMRRFSVMDAIFDHIPRPIQFLTEILDSRIIPNNADINSPNFKVTLDFSILCPHGAERQMEVVMALMDSGNDFQQKQIVRHPLLKTFLRFKWQQLRIFFYLLMVLHFCFVLSLSTFCYFKINAIRKGEPDNPLQLNIAHYVLMATAIMWLLLFIIQVIMIPTHHMVQIETWIHLLGIILSLTAAVDHLIEVKHHAEPDCWIIHVMSFAVLNVWIEFMFLIGRIPRWGYYSLMFYQVLWNVAKVLMIFSSLIIGFTLSFMLQFHKVHSFKELWNSFVKTIVMMTGEYEYENLFKEDDNMPIKNTDMNMTRSSNQGLEGTSKFIFLLFIILASIVLINLMVGLAVSDIQELQAEGHIQRLLKQAEFVTQLEKITTHRLMPHCLHRLFNNRKTIKTKFEVYPSAFSPTKTKISYYLLERIVHTAIHNWRKSHKHVSEYPASIKDLQNKKVVREYSNISEILPPSPTRTAASESLISLMHQIQQEITQIKETLHEKKEDMSHYERNEDVSLRVKRWTRHFNDVRRSSGVSVRRLRRVNSKTADSNV